MADRILYIEASSGISGDMLLGSLLDVGVPPEVLYEAWNALDIDNYEVEIFETKKSDMRALRCRVHTEEKQGPRTWKAYESILKKAKLKDSVRKNALQLCSTLFEIEGAIHGMPLQKLHLHEMGGTDLLIDVVGTLAAVDHLAPSIITASAVNTGKGFITFSHGKVPVPAPATSRILTGVPVFQNEISGELTTPTGALLVKHLAKSFGDLPLMKVEKIGVGAGEREIPHHPNVMRIFLGTSVKGDADDDHIYMAESNVDDSNPQILAYFMEKAFENGALDVFFTPIVMKKNRPAVRVSMLVPQAQLQTVVRLLFSETTAIGLRYWKVEREKLERRWKPIKFRKQEIRIKESLLDGNVLNYQPEYEDCKRAAAALGLPVKEVMAGAIATYLK